MGSSIKDVGIEGGGRVKQNADKSRQADKGGRGFQWKRTSALTHVGICFKEWALSAHSISISNRAGQTDITDTSCTMAPALRQFWAFSTETVDEWDEIPLPYHDTALVSHSPMDGAWSRLHGHNTRPDGHGIPRVQVRTSTGRRGEGLGKCGQGGRGSILADILRMSLLSPPPLLRLQLWLPFPPLLLQLLLIF